MSKFSKFFKSKNIISIIIAVVLIFVIIFVGRYFGASWVVQVVIIVFFLLVGAIFFLFKKMRDAQKAGKIEESINNSADAQMANLSPEKRAEIEQFKKQLEAAITSLKNSKIGKGKTGKAALYALPWYMIIGPSAAGKTTAIQNSGLEFPFGRDGFRGVGGTRNCDWFFSTKAIFLDTAGRYVTQSEDRVEWLAFLDTLKKNRKKKPVNGVIVALNIDEIIGSENENLYNHAKGIRQRIDELIENLGVNFPVYFMFTKCDLIQGFVEYFGDFSEIERSQIWGATLTTQQQLNTDAKAVFETEFQKLSEKIFSIRTIRLSSPLKRDQRRKVFLFPFQFKSLQKKLTYLIGEVFQNNPYQDNPIFRGFYFTSGTQEGAPLDLAIKEIAKQFNLPASVQEEESEKFETKHYFIKDFLNDIVIGDQNYSAGQTTGTVKRRSTAKLVTASVSVFLLVLFSIFAFIGYNGSGDTLDKISETATSFSKINWSGDLLSNFTEAENLRSLIEKIENGDANEAFISFGMDRSELTLNYLNDLYLKKTETFFTNNIYNEIVFHLTNYANGKDYPGEESYNNLKAYLLLGNERTRLDTSGQKFLAGVFSNILNTKFIKSNPLASTAEKDSLKILFNNYAVFFASKLDDEKVYQAKLDNLLTNIVRDRLQYKPNAENIYARIKQSGIDQFPNEMSLEQIVGGRFVSVMKTDVRIPYIFTADGWMNYVRETLIEESLNPGSEDWVLGKSRINPASAPDFNSEEMRRNLLLLYLNDYRNTWLQMIQGIRYSGFESVPLAANNLKMLSDPVGSPLIILLKVFADQMQIIADMQSPADTSQASVLKQFNIGNAKLPEVAKYRKFVLGGSDAPAGGDLNAMIVQYASISSMLENIKGGQDLTKDYAVNVINQRAIELSTAQQVIKGALFNLPEFQNMFMEPVRLTWKSILSDASQYLNSQWKSKVVDTFNKSLSTSFPFKPTGSDAPIQDFKDFFKPQDGVLWSFFNQELSAFINKDRWRVNQWENEGLNVSEDLINTLKKADDISSTLFKGGDLSISFRLKPELPNSKPVLNRKPVIEQVYLNIDGIETQYKMGAPFWNDYSWPGGRGAPGTRMNILIRDYGTSEAKMFDGEWALFRLLNDATISRGESASQYKLNWFFKKEGIYDVIVTYTLNASSSRNPFSSNFFKNFTLPTKIN
ncbi:MAG: type VI secretion system membrane subunit TssM [Ignavibacteriaceae bacterium]